jgi:LysM repeat protein
MPIVRPTLALSALLLLSGCGFVHFGRLPQTGGGAAGGDAAMAEAYTNLATEHKILKQELALARKEGDALRATIERAGSGSPDLVARLEETTRELTTLRASYERLQSSRGGTPTGAEDPATRARLAEIEEKLAASLRNYTQLQEENARLRQDVDRVRGENIVLAEQLKTAVARNDQAQTALAQLNTELLAQKEARVRAEQASSAAQAQLVAVMAARTGGAPLSAARETSADAAAALQAPKAPSSGAAAELRVNTERLRNNTAAGAPAPEGAGGAKPPRTHVVEPGDTLEKLALKYYGAPSLWRRIYEANEAVLGNGRPLASGMRLAIPEN